jgi:hypothetical protein
MIVVCKRHTFTGDQKSTKTSFGISENKIRGRVGSKILYHFPEI